MRSFRPLVGPAWHRSGPTHGRPSNEADFPSSRCTGGLSPLGAEPEPENPSARARMRGLPQTNCTQALAARTPIDGRTHRMTTMAQANLGPRISKRGGDRVPVSTRILLTGEDGTPLLDGAVCTNIGLGGVCVRAAQGIDPGTALRLEVRLFGGRSFTCRGHVCWSRVTLHPALLGTPKGMPDDARFGICFDGASTQDLLPIARLLVAREDARRRGRRIRRLHGFPARA